MSSDTLVIRPAMPGDVPEIRLLIHELAAYEKQPEAAIATEADLMRDGFGPDRYFQCLMAEIAGNVAGFSLYFFQYSTWEGRPTLYLEDLFVREQYRKRGIGKTMLQHLAQIAIDRNCTRVQWECLDWNKPSLDFYSSIGAEVMHEWLNLRMTGDAIRALASGQVIE